MKKPPSLEELRGNLRSAASPAEYHLFFAALLREASGISPESFVVVGGSAIEAYTVGRYTSGDIDVVADDYMSIQAVLRAWKFEKQGRIWHNSSLQLFVDLVKPPYTGSLERTTLMPTPFGPVRLAAVEDLFVKRLSATKHWGVRGDIEHAKLLALSFGESMDWEYAEAFAAEHDVLDLAREVRATVRKQARARKE